MKYIYLDAIGGASGDMLLGAFLDSFVPLDYFQNSIAELGLPDYQIKLEKTQRHHIAARKFGVLSSDRTPRHLKDIIQIISKSALSNFVKDQSIAVFRKLGEHEAKIHNVLLEKVHFHEVGAVDSIIDIVGTFICLDYVNVDKIFTSPLPVSRGFVKASHGRLPVPAPATLALLKGYPLDYRAVEAELVTPTGAVLFTHISHGGLPLSSQFTVSQIGYGAGSKDFPEFPNLLRIWSGELLDEVEHETVIQIETNIDDMNPEIFPHLQQLLFEAGVMDVTFYPGIMKKGRQGTLISILSDVSLLDTIRNILYSQTTTIGFRYFPLHREKLPREIRKIDSPWGKIQMKVVKWQNSERWLPEYEECRRIAERTGEPLLTVYQKIQLFLVQKQSS